MLARTSTGSQLKDRLYTAVIHSKNQITQPGYNPGRNTSRAPLHFMKVFRESFLWLISRRILIGFYFC